jgi:hypothetical protein
MKTQLISILAVLISLSPANGQDQTFVYYDPFNNLANVAGDKNDFIFDNLWQNYTRFLSEISKPVNFHTTGGYSREDTIKWTTLARFDYLLNAMLELRAFAAQNKISEIQPNQTIALGKINLVLNQLNLFYKQDNDKSLSSFCDEAGVDKLQKSVLPLTKP